MSDEEHHSPTRSPGRFETAGVEASRDKPAAFISQPHRAQRFAAVPLQQQSQGRMSSSGDEGPKRRDFAEASPTHSTKDHLEPGGDSEDVI